MALKKGAFDGFPEPKDRYGLEDCLGCGAFGRVFAATDSEASNKKVAVKVQKLSENTTVFAEQEYKVLRDLSSHGNLPDFYGVYRKEDELWFVMEVIFYCLSLPRFLVLFTPKICFLKFAILLVLLVFGKEFF